MAMHNSVRRNFRQANIPYAAAVFTWAKVCGVRYRPLDLVHSTETKIQRLGNG